jgi:glyoxylase-like metal-dependent hydrolase (beta-lactamase superfamily II)
MSVAVPPLDDRYGHKIADGAHIIGPRKRATTKGGYSRAYLFEDGKDLTLVDTGWDEDANTIVRYLDSIGRSPTQIKQIGITHAHRSHLGGMATLHALTGADVRCHAAEAPIVEGRKRAHAVRFWPLLPLTLIPFRIGAKFDIPKHRPCEVDPRYLVHGDRLGPLDVIHTPGHTPGHLVFRYRDTKVFAVGDAVATWPKFAPGWPGFNLDDCGYRFSLVKLVALDPEVVGPGHGDEVPEPVHARLATLVNGRKFRNLKPPPEARA